MSVPSPIYVRGINVVCYHDFVGQNGMSYEICGNCGDTCWGNNSDLNYFKVRCYQWFFLNKFCHFLPKELQF